MSTKIETNNDVAKLVAQKHQAAIDQTTQLRITMEEFVRLVEQLLHRDVNVDAKDILAELLHLSDYVFDTGSIIAETLKDMEYEVDKLLREVRE